MKNSVDRNNYLFPFQNLDDEDMEILRNNENVKIIYDNITKLPEHERMDAVRWSILILNGIATTEQAIEWHKKRMGV